MFEELVARLKRASRVVLSTHRHCDGDGLGAELALSLGLRSLGKDVWIFNPDPPPKKYAFLDLSPVRWDEDVPSADLALILDTNDRRLVEPLIPVLEKRCVSVLFVDHHPELAAGPSPTAGSVIDVSAASTGEIAFRLLQALGVEMTTAIARALYTSVVFDTQMFRFVKSDPRSHLMAAELLRYEREPEVVHQALFATYTAEKMSWLARALSQVEYFAEGRAALLVVDAAEAARAGVDADECADVIDQVMNVGRVSVGALLRDDGDGAVKLSLRSKGFVRVLPLAEDFGGGGHAFASGAYLRGDLAELRAKVLARVSELVAGGLHG